MSKKPLKIAFVHPDLGIGGAERLVVDAALGLQRLGHSVQIFTSHHNKEHCFEETRDGTLSVVAPKPPFPRSWKGKFHILFANARQLHLITHLLRPGAPKFDVFFVDQLSTCVPLLRWCSGTRVVFYCHFPDKLLADGAYVEGQMERKGGTLKQLYRYPIDKLEEVTTRQSDVILANSKFTGRVFRAHFPSIGADPTVVYPGVNLAAYAATSFDKSDPDVVQVLSDRPTLLSLNRFEKKKNAALAIEAFALLREKLPRDSPLSNMRLVLAGGYDRRLEDNMMTLVHLIDRARAHSLTFDIITSSGSSTKIPEFNTTLSNPHILILLNFSTPQRSSLLSSPSTLALLYTPTNEHFGIGPVEAMVCGLPVLACNSGGPTESVVDSEEGRTGWLREPDPRVWAETLWDVVHMSEKERMALSERAKKRAREYFGMEAMANGIEDALVKAVGMGPVPVSPAVWVAILGLIALVFAFVFAS